MNNKKHIISSIILGILAIVYIILVKTVDVQEIIRTGSNVGFATLNEWFWNLTGHNEILDKIYNLCDKYITFEDILKKIFDDYNLQMNLAGNN